MKSRNVISHPLTGAVLSVMLGVLAVYALPVDLLPAGSPARTVIFFFLGLALGLFYPRWWWLLGTSIVSVPILIMLPFWGIEITLHVLGLPLASALLGAFVGRLGHKSATSDSD